MTGSQVETRSVGDARLNRRAVPNVPIIAHDGNEYLFYEDLVRDQVVLISFMSIDHDAHHPSSPKMAAIQAILNQIPGDTTRLLSISVDPSRDSPQRLAAYANNMGADDSGRWRFLHTTQDNVEALRAAFYVHRGFARQYGMTQLFSRADLLRLPPKKAVMDCSMGLMRYGNEALDIWGGAPARASAEDIAARLAWVRGKNSETRLRRRGGPGRKV